MLRDLDEIDTLMDEDVFLSNIKKVLQHNPAAYPKFLMGNSLSYKGRTVIPSNSPIILLLLNEFHASVVSGHGGVRRTYQRIATKFYWLRSHSKNLLRLVTFVKGTNMIQLHLQVYYSLFMSLIKFGILDNGFH